MWRRPRLVTAENEKPGNRSLADVPGGRGAFAPDPATGTEAGPGPTTPRRSAVRRASRVAREGPRLASGAARVTFATPTRLGGSPRAPHPPPSGGRPRRRKGRKKNPDGIKEPGLKKLRCLTL